MIVRGVMREWKPEKPAATVSLDALLCGEESGEGDERFVDGLAGDQDVEQEMLDSEARAVIRSAVGALPAPQRRLIERRFFEEISLAHRSQLKLPRDLSRGREAVFCVSVCA
jgi:DNA-directed RNA polymerase specialized sigma24 family protein